MPIVRIDDFEGLRAVREDWERAYAADANAQVFVAYDWLTSWLEIAPPGGFVLAFQPEGSAHHVAFLPLCVRSTSVRGAALHRALHFAAKPFGPLTGFVADPAHEEDALRAFGEYVVDHLEWDELPLEDVIDPRIEIFLAAIERPGIEVQREEPLCCPLLQLPDSWDGYLADCMSHKGRANLRRSLRQIEAFEDYRATEPTDSTFEFELETLLSLWESRWGDLSERDRDEYRHMYGRAHAEGRLFMRTLWTGQTPIASLAAFADPVHRTVAYYTSGFDSDFDKYSPGKAIVGHCIRAAIEEKYRVFDFLVGGHGYKLDFFGAEERFATRGKIVRKSLRASAGRLLLGARDRLRSATGRNQH